MVTKTLIILCQTVLDDGDWSSRNLPKEKYDKTVALTLKGVKLNMATKGIDRFHKVRIRFTVIKNSVYKP